MLDLIHAAGWPVWLLVCTSVVGLAIIIERLLSLRTARVLPARLPSQVLEIVRQRNDDSEAIVRLAGSSPLGRVLAEVLVNRHDSPQGRQVATEDVGKDDAHQLNRYLPA